MHTLKSRGQNNKRFSHDHAGPLSEQQKSFDITTAGETNLDLILYGLPEEMLVERELLGSGFKITLDGSSH